MRGAMKVFWNRTGIALTLIPVLLVMGLIFGFSAQNGETSGGLSRQITAWLAGIFIPDFELLAQEQQELIHSYMGLAIRKMGHFTEFAALGFFLMLHIHQIARRTAVFHLWLWAWAVGTVYAVSDEVHQHFVGGRNPAVTDVLIDSAGVIAGVCLLLLFLRWQTKRSNK